MRCPQRPYMKILVLKIEKTVDNTYRNGTKLDKYVPVDAAKALGSHSQILEYLVQQLQFFVDDYNTTKPELI